MLPFTFDKTLTLQRLTATLDGSGMPVASSTASTLATFSGCIQPASDRVVNDYRARNMLVDYQVYTIADLSAVAIKVGDRVKDGGTFYVVQGVKPYASLLSSSDKLWVLDCTLRN